MNTHVCVKDWSGYFFARQKSLSVKPDPQGHAQKNVLDVEGIY